MRNTAQDAAHREVRKSFNHHEKTRDSQTDVGVQLRSDRLLIQPRQDRFGLVIKVRAQNPRKARTIPRL